MRVDFRKVMHDARKTESVGVSLSEEQKMYLEAIADTRGMCVSTFVRNILAQVIDAYGEAALQELEQRATNPLPPAPPKPKRPRGRPKIAR